MKLLGCRDGETVLFCAPSNDPYGKYYMGLTIICLSYPKGTRLE